MITPVGTIGVKPLDISTPKMVVLRPVNDWAALPKV